MRTDYRVKTPEQGKEFPEEDDKMRSYLPNALLPRKFSRRYATVS
jgi:hypothetical protein